MLYRKNRRWQFLTLDEVIQLGRKYDSVSVWGETLSDPMMESTDCLSGRELTFRFDDGLVWRYRFEDGKYLRWETNDGRSGREFYNASPAKGDDNIIFLHHYCTMEVPGCADLIMDFDTGYAVLFDASLGHPAAPREIIREVRFGTIGGITPDPKAEKPHYTNDLVGKAIRWSHPEGKRRGIKYIFSSYCYLTYAMTFKDTDLCFMATNPCDQIKIRDDLYICSTIEERQTGVELVMLMNLSLMSDVQAIFGIGGTTEEGINMISSMHSGRVGTWEEMGTDLYHTEP